MDIQTLISEQVKKNVTDKMKGKLLKVTKELAYAGAKEVDDEVIKQLDAERDRIAEAMASSVAIKFLEAIPAPKIKKEKETT